VNYLRWGLDKRLLGLILIVATLTGCAVQEAPKGAGRDVPMARTSKEGQTQGTSASSPGSNQPATKPVEQSGVKPPVPPADNPIEQPTAQPTAQPATKAAEQAAAKPVEQPTPKPVETALTVTKAPGTVGRNSTASVTVKTAPGAECYITVTYKSGPSKAQGLGPKKADDIGVVSWSWRVGGNTTRGTWPVTITCAGKTVSTSVTVP
jgi:cytoskeletal protein RodZ